MLARSIAVIMFMKSLSKTIASRESSDRLCAAFVYVWVSFRFPSLISLLSWSTFFLESHFMNNWISLKSADMNDRFMDISHQTIKQLKVLSDSHFIKPHRHQLAEIFWCLSWAWDQRFFVEKPNTTWALLNVKSVSNHRDVSNRYAIFSIYTRPKVKNFRWLTWDDEIFCAAML